MQICVLVATSLPVRANPLAPTVVAGQAAFDANGAALTITTGDRAVIDWQSFGINAGEVTHFIQPNAHSAVLNRVTGGDPSALLGTLQANGQVYLINPNGIVVGPGAYINAGSFMATTLDIDNALFMRGGDLDFKGTSNAPIINHGTIRAIEGNVYLVANRVENHGIISASGTVGLAAAHDVRVVDGAHPHLVVRPSSASTSNATGGVVNTGLVEAAKAELLAAHGNVYALAINNTGTVRTNGVEINEDGIFLKANGGRIVNTGNLTAKNADGSGGRVVIDSSTPKSDVAAATTATQAAAAGTGSVALSGTVDVSADAAGKSGGSVHVTGDDITLTGATINADGPAGGGVVRIGGDYQGGAGLASPLATALKTTIDSGTSIRANATQTGDAGRVIVWADGTTRYAGSIEARGAAGGAGGFAEVSGKQILEYHGSADLGGGTLLLDPGDFTIDAATAASIVSALSSADVKVTTNGATAGNGDIFINSPIVWNSTRALMILAHRHIYANADIINSGIGGIALTAGWDGMTDYNTTAGVALTSNINVESFGARPATFGNGGGNVIVDRSGTSTRVAIGTVGGMLMVAGNDVVVKGSQTSDSGFAQLGYRSPTANGQLGSIVIRANNDILVTAQLGAAHIGLGVDNTTIDFLASAARSASIDVLAGRDIVIQGGTGVNVSYAMIGNGGLNSDGSFNGSILATAGRNLNVLAGSNGSIAMLGHGGYNSNGTLSGGIVVSAAEVTVRGGSGFTTYAQIGHGGEASASGTDISNGNIRVDAGKLNLESGFFSGAYAQIGNGGNSYTSTAGPRGAIDVTVTGELSFSNGGAGAARIGHWSNTSVAFTSAPVRISAASVDAVFNNSTPATTADLTNLLSVLVNNLKGGDVTFTATGVNGNDGSLIVPTFSASSTPGNTLMLKSTGNAALSNTLTFNGSSTFALVAAGDVNINNIFTHSTGTGGLLLRGDSDGNGVGNVNFSGAGKAAFTGSNAAVTIRYNPTSYASPTNFVSAGRVELGSSGATLSAQMLVNNVTQLQAVSTNLSGSYVLGRDIDAAATSGWNSGAGFAPLTGFSGTFEGDGRVVAGLVVNRGSTDQVGLFGSSSGTIRNLGLVAASIVGGNRTGGLIGENSGTLSTVYIEGSVRGGQYVGGLVGWNAGTISNAYSGAAVIGTADVVGGLVGNHNSGTISNSYAIGAASGTTDVGGLVGTNRGTLSLVYATGLVTGSLRTGGLVGANTGTVTNGFYDSSTTGAAGVGTALNSSTAFTQASYTGFDFTNVWYIRANFTRPILRSEFSTTLHTAHQVALIDIALVREYVLARNIDLSETRNTSGSGVWKQGQGFAPIAGFTGKLDGAGRALDGLYINIPGGTGIGLFNTTFAAYIHDLKLTNVDLTSNGFTGALAYQAAQGTLIRNVEASGTVRGGTQSAGLVGFALGATIENSRSSVNVTGTGPVAGGLIGATNMATIRNSSASGSVTGTSDVGGLIGIANYSLIENSSAGAAVFAGSLSGGLVGESNRSSYNNSFATSIVQGTVASPGSMGGFVGYSRDSSYFRSYAAGDVSGMPASPNTGGSIGGFAGLMNNGSIRESYATGIVRGQSSVGGLVGVTSGNGLNDDLNVIDKSYATGAVIGNVFVGGLIGLVADTTVTTSYATGTVTASGNNAGGIAGSSSGIFRDVYATGAVSGSANVGGLAGTLNNAVVERSFSSGAVTGTTTIGGLLAATTNSTVTNSFWDTQTSGLSTSAGGAGAVGRTTAQMKTLSTFTGAGWDFVNTWQIFQGVTYPHFQYQTISGVTVVGTVYAADGVTKAGSGLNVTLVQNGTVVGTATTNGSSIFKFIAPLSNNDALVAYLDGNVGKQGATGWRTDGASTTALNILGSSLTATSTATKFADNAMFRQAAGSVVDTDLSYTSTLVGGETSLSVAQGYRFYVPVGQTYRLDGNLSTAGGNVDLLGTVVVTATAPTIRTDAVGGTLAAGSVKFAATGSINALVAGAQSLTINTTADGGGAAGAVRLADVGTLQRLRSLTVSSGAGLLELTDTDADGTAKILVTTGNIDFSNVADVQFNANTLLNTQPTAAGQGSVLFQTAGGGAIGNVAGRNLTIDVRGAATGVDDDGDVSLFADFGTNAIVGGSLDVATDRGTITLGTGTFATYKTRDTGAGFAMRFIGDAVLTGDITFESNNGVLDFDSTTFSSNSLGRWFLTLHSDGGFDPAADIRFAGAGNAGGNYLRGITLDADSFFHPADGKVIFVDDRDSQVSILTDTDFFAFTGLAVQANNLILEDSTLVGSMGASPGRINLGTALIDAKFDDLGLTLTTVGATFGGQIEFGTVGRDTVAGGGHYLGNFSAAVNGTGFTGSRTTLDSDITIDNTLGTGSVTLIGRVEVTGARTITTQVGNDAAAGSVNLAGAQLYGTATGYGLTLNASAVGFTGGDVELGAFGNDGNSASYIQTLDIDARGSTGGAIVLSGGTITLDGAGAVANASRFTALGAGIVLNGSVTIRTEVGNDQNAGSIDFSSTPISAAAAGYDLTINTLTAAAGGTSGDITLGDLGNGFVRGFGGFYVNDLLLDSSGTQSGKIMTGANVLLDALGSDVAGVTFAGRFVLARSTLIDTEAGNDAAAGAIDLRLATVSAAAVNYNLTLDSSTTAAGAAGGNVQLRSVANAGGQFVNDVVIDARAGAGGTPGTLALDANLTTARNFSFVGGAASIVGTTTVLSSGGTISLLATQGTASGITMADGSTLQTRSGSIILSANAAISLSRVSSDSDNDNTRGDVALTADADSSGTGSILDILTGESANITARNVSLLAADRIGSITDFAAGTGDGIDITLNGTLQAARVTQANGQIFLAFQSNVAADAGAIVVNQTGIASLILQGTGNVDLGTAGSLVTSTGDNIAISAAQVLTLPATGIDVGTGLMRLTGTTDIRDADRSLATLAASSLTFTSGNSGGAITLATTVGSLSASVGANDLSINETDGLTALNIAAGTGAFTLTAGGSILDADATIDIAAATATITLNGAFGSSTNAIGTTVAGLSVNSGNGSQWINQSAGLTALNLNSGTGAVTLAAGGSILDNDASVDIVAVSANVQLTSGSFGSISATLGTTVGNISVSTINADQWFRNTTNVTALNLAAGTGLIFFNNTGSVQDSDAALDLVALRTTFVATGNMGSSVNPIGINVDFLTAATNTGSAWLAEFDGLASMNLNATQGTFNLVSGGPLTDTDAVTDVEALGANIQVTNGDVGTAANRIGFTVSTLAVDTAGGNQWIYSFNGLTAIDLAAGTGNIDLDVAGSILDTDGLPDIKGATAAIRTTGAFGTSLNAIGTTVSGLAVDSVNGNQFITETDGLSVLNLSAGTGAISLTAGGAITDADAAVDILASAAAVQLNGNFGAVSDAIGTTVSGLSIDSTNGSQFITETDGLSALNLAAGTGNITLTAGGSILDSDSLADIIAASAVLRTTVGDIGSAANPIGTALASLTTNSSLGSQWFTNAGALTVQDMQASGLGASIQLRALTGSIDLVRVAAVGTVDVTAVAGAIRDGGTEVSPNVTASLVRLTAADGIGLTGNGDFDLDALNVSAVNSSSGGIFLQTTGALPVSFDLVDVQNSDGRIELDSLGEASLVDIRSAGGPISAGVAGFADLSAIKVNAAATGTIDLRAGRDLFVRGEVAGSSGAVSVFAGRDVDLDTTAALRDIVVRALGGNVRITAGRDVLLSASAGRTAEVGAQSGRVSVAAERDVVLGGATNGTARIGGRSGSVGDIEVVSGGSTQLSATTGGLAHIGHVHGSGRVLVAADLNLVLGSSADSIAQIGHLTNTGSAGVDVAWNQAAPFGGGSGMFVMRRSADGTTAITAGGSAARVRLFGGLRDDLVLLDRGVEINTHPFTGLRTLYPQAPIAGVAGSAWDQTIQYFNNPFEQWGPTTLGSTTLETSPFTFYFYSPTPGLSAGGQANFFGLLNGLGFEYERARYLLDGLGRTIQVRTTAEVDPLIFEQRRRTAIGPEITGGSSL